MALIGNLLQYVQKQLRQIATLGPISDLQRTFSPLSTHLGRSIPDVLARLPVVH